MKITIDYIAQANAAAGTNSETCTVADNCSLLELLATAAEKRGAALANLVFCPDGKIRPSILIAINNDLIFIRNPPSLNNGDVVALMPPMSGG